MLVLIDESGCTGFRPGSSTHFVIGMIIFDTFHDAEEAANIIHKLKKETGFRREFRFSHCDNKSRTLFFDAIRKARFKARIFVVEKRIIRSSLLQKKDEMFINYCIKNLMKDGMHRIKDATVKIDGKGSRRFKNECASYLRRELPAEVIKTIKFCDSKNDVLVQLADMVVSAYARPYNNPGKSDAFEWRNRIEAKIENVWNFM